VVSHAGAGLLREMADSTGLVDQMTAALIDTYRQRPVHAPGRVLTDLAVAVADGADAISGIAVLADREELFGPVASLPTAWRVLNRVDEARLPAVRAARAQARERAWAAGAAPDLAAGLVMDFDATITIAHSEKQNAAATWKKTFGFHPLLCFLDRPEVAGGEALAGCGRGTPAATPQPITSRCCKWRWRHCPSRLGHGPVTRTARSCWPGPTRPAPAASSPPPAAPTASGSPSGSPSMNGSRRSST
jgi:hypothetical protein